MDKNPTVKERADVIYRRLSVVMRVIATIETGDPGEDDVIIEMQRLCRESCDEAFELINCSVADTPVPEHDDLPTQSTGDAVDVVEPDEADGLADINRAERIRNRLILIDAAASGAASDGAPENAEVLISIAGAAVEALAELDAMGERGRP